MRLRGSWSRLLVVLALVAALLALFLPASSHVRAAALLQRFAEPDSRSLLTRIAYFPIEERNFAIPSTRARLYVPVGFRHPPGVVLVHGIHYEGIDEPRLVRFARTFAAAGIAVLTPEIRELCDYRIDPVSVETIGEATLALSSHLGGLHVGVMGLSFAGGLALIAATDDRYRKAFAFVVAVGAHDDMDRVLQYFLTNEAPRPDGTKLRRHAHDYGPAIVVYSHVEDFFSPQDVPLARDALRLWLHEDFDAARARAQALSPDGAAKWRHVLSRDTAAIGPELEAEVRHLKPSLAAVSPNAHLAAIRVPVFLLHGANDTVIPSSETEWLAHDTPPSMLRAVLVSRAIEHVDLEREKKVGEEWLLVQFMSAVLDATDEEH